MKRLISLIASLLIAASSVQAFAFSDVSNSSSVYKITSELKNLDVIDGYEDDTFRPDAEITRAEMTRIALNLLPKVVDSGVITIDFSGSALYSDISKLHWADDDIGRMSSLNIINGYDDGTFRPDANITYQEVIKIIIEMLNYGDEVEKLGGYPDGYISEAAKLGITNNVDFIATDNAKRGDVAIMIYNSLDIPNKVITSYTVGQGAEYKIDQNVTFRSMITGAK